MKNYYPVWVEQSKTQQLFRFEEIKSLHSRQGIGYAAAEIAIAVLTAGAATGAKWAGKMSAKAIEVIKKIPGVAKLAEKVKTIKIPAVVKQRLKNANYEGMVLV